VHNLERNSKPASHYCLWSKNVCCAFVVSATGKTLICSWLSRNLMLAGYGGVLSWLLCSSLNGALSIRVGDVIGHVAEQGYLRYR
jgi:hypothetical protein